MTGKTPQIDCARILGGTPVLATKAPTFDPHRPHRGPQRGSKGTTSTTER